MNGIRCVRRGLGGASLLVLSVTFLASGCSRTATTGPEEVRPVKTMVVTAGGEPHLRSFPGTVEASKRVELAFQVPGKLVHFPVKEGQRVARGEVIAQLRQDEFAARLKIAQGQLDQARAGLRALRSGDRPEQQRRLEAQVRAAEAKLANAQAERDRNQRLLRTNSVSREEADVTETNYRVAWEDFQAARKMLEKGTVGRVEDIEAREAEVRGLEGQVVQANLQLEDTTLRAPYDGVIAKRFVEQEQDVTAKQAIVRFQDVDEIVVAVDVPETVMAADIRTADIVEMSAEFSAAPGVRFPVHITEMAQTADPQTQTFRVRVAMKAPENLTLKDGMTGTVFLTYHRASILGDAVLVPISAVFKDGSGEQVAWVIGPDSAVARRRVKVGAATGDRIEILEGLQSGDRIATAGVTHLREGMKVRDLGDALGGGQP
jgi:multidrug efflux pump subunit AcrA (membrane-fusion protein)